MRAYRERQLAALGMRALFPLWLRDTRALAREFIDRGFEAVLVCVDPAKIGPSFAGRLFDSKLLQDLPGGADPCGENGEFHTFVFNGPVFIRPVPIIVGSVVERDGFVFCDLTPGPALEPRTARSSKAGDPRCRAQKPPNGGHQAP